MLFKLSLKNMKKSMKDYTIYFMTLLFAIAVFYIFNSLDSQTAMLELSKSKSDVIQSIITIMTPISVFVSIILGYLIIYANNFLIRRRKKEFGIYQTLGMSKGKITQILVIEAFLIGLVSLGLGLLLGVMVSQGLSVIVARLFQADMTAYEFAFSKGAFEKTIIYFGIIYFLVMLFNVITVSRFRLIHLLMAAKKNETLKVKRPVWTALMFVASLVLIGTAYYLLLKGNAILVVGSKFVIMLLCGAVGTYLFFSSLAGFLLKLVQYNKKLYYKQLNLFVLNQLNSKINTAKLSITVISLMLLLTIGIMASALSMTNAYNSNLEETNYTDITFTKYLGTPSQEADELTANTTGSIVSRLKEDQFDTSHFFKEYMEYRIYEEEGNDLLSYLSEAQQKQLKGQTDSSSFYVSLNVMKQSEFNQLMDLYGHGEKKIQLSGTKFAIVANFEMMVPFFKEQLEQGKGIEIKGTQYEPGLNTVIEVALGNSNMKSEFGTLVIPDEAFPAGLTLAKTNLCANYNAASDEEKETIEEELKQAIDEKYTQNKELSRPYTYEYSKLEMEAASVGLTAMLTFIGLYLGIIFTITSAAILAIGQLSESTDNKERYAVLRRIGVDDRMIDHSLFLQIGIYFLLPLVVALIHSIVGLKEVTRIISVYGHMDLTKNIMITALFLVIVYGGYFLATYIGSKGIIKEQEKYCD